MSVSIYRSKKLTETGVHNPEGFDLQSVAHDLTIWGLRNDDVINLHI